MRYIIDADTYCYKLAYFNEKLEDDIKLRYNVTNYINKILLDLIIDKDKITNDDYILLLSSKNNNRKEITDNYKSNRVQHFKWLSKIYKIIKEEYNTLTIDGYEADDLAATLMKEDNSNNIVVHEDKDLLQIPGVHIFRGNLIVITQLDAFLFLMKQLLMGDNTDNITAIKGIGKKISKKIINDNNIIDIVGIILDKYIEQYGNLGLETFYKNYKLLNLNSNIKWKK